MRKIEVSTEVFRKIWSAAREGDESENDILDRILIERARRIANEVSLDDCETREIDVRAHKRRIRTGGRGRITWIDDVHDALVDLGGHGHLSEIYEQVKKQRKNGRRSLPGTTEAVIRKTLEENSSDSMAYRGGEDLFALRGRKGSGLWGLK